MNATPSKLKAFAELGRISNMPTCLTNVMVGCSIDTVGETLDWNRTLLVTLAVALLYTGGMAMNDVFDEGVDRRERPERPIPSGRISRSSAIVFMVLCLIAGLMILGWFGGPTLYLGLLLLGLITCYNAIHKQVSGSFVLMGACRATVYAVAASTVMWPPVWWFVIGFGVTIFIYTSMITIIARSENQKHLGRQRGLAWIMPLLFIPPLILPSYLNSILILIAFVVGIAWMLRAVRLVWRVPPMTKEAVLTWLSGMCLLDAFFLSLMDQPILFGLAVACFVLTHFGHRKILGT
ncbi:MAG: UbiA family prenyltransferase [Candidatus Omnitrophica bacterium]|nr:UbiA family prenyltransferase [Candidatus Omnitrophota bacterium]